MISENKLPKRLVSMKRYVSKAVCRDLSCTFSKVENEAIYKRVCVTISQKVNGQAQKIRNCKSESQITVVLESLKGT